MISLILNAAPDANSSFGLMIFMVMIKSVNCDRNESKKDVNNQHVVNALGDNPLTLGFPIIMLCNKVI